MHFPLTLSNSIKQVGNCTFLKVHNAILPDRTPVTPYCDAALQKLECSAVCDNTPIMDFITRPADENYSPALSYQFWLFFLILIVAWSSMAVVASVGDAICFGMLGNKISFSLLPYFNFLNEAPVFYSYASKLTL